MRKTKIVCTLGPATDSENVLKKLFENGMNVARLNFSHGTHEDHFERIALFTSLREKYVSPVGLLLDTKGPEIRLKTFENDSVQLKTGSVFTLTTEDIIGNEERVSITYDGLPSDIKKRDRILIDDGLVELQVLKKDSKDIECEVINGGTISNRKSVNVPDITVSLPFMSERDMQDLEFAIKNDVDFIAASFVRSAVDIKNMRDFLEDRKGEFIKIIAKIENRDGVKNIDEIIRVSDGIMVARGDMGVEIPFEELPHIQKSIIHKCNRAGKPVITATQMIDSMIRNPRPTRAEITDIANAIYDGTSALMLSGETSIGKYPVESVATMSKIAIETEKNINYEKIFKNTNVTVSRNVTNAISQATCTSAHALGASAIISVTKSGHTARMVSKYRPSCPIIATTFSMKTFNQLSISWSVYPILTVLKETTDDIFDQAITKSLNSNYIKNGDLVVITGGMIADASGTTNTLKVHIVGDVLAEGQGVNEFKSTGNIYVFDRENLNERYFNAGDIIVIHKTTDEILPLLKSAAGIITEESMESKSVIVGKALEIPVIAGVYNASEILKSGTIVTVDAKAGLVYAGVR